MTGDKRREIDLDEGRGGRMTMAEARAATTRPPFSKDRAYVLMPAWLAAQIPSVEEIVDAPEPMIYARYFSAENTSWSWHVEAYDRESDTAYAWVFSPHAPDAEFGGVWIPELEGMRTPWGLPGVERDLLVKTPYPLSRAASLDAPDSASNAGLDPIDEVTDDDEE